MATCINGNSSLVLSRLLDSMGLDEDNRQRRMDRQKMQQLLWSWQYESMIGGVSVQLSGSAYETTTIDGLSSDVDRIYIPHHIRVIDNLQQWTPNTRTYMIDNTGCYTAFVKLYQLSPEYPGPLYSAMESDIPANHIVDEEGKIFFSNDVNTKYILEHSTSPIEVHGPAVTSNAGTDVDYVCALKCESFPKEAEHWKHRQTHVTRARIGGSIVDQAACCYLVGVGNKGSPTENIEWRLSFTHIEKELVHAWNNVQYKCYVFIKFLHKDLIKENSPDCILCSYHYKTTLMWMVEEHKAEFFSESNFDNCVLQVLKNLATSVTRKSLPHYFVQGCNLFHNKLDEKSSKQISSVIEGVIDKWPYCLFDIKRRHLGKQIRDSLLQHVSVDSICKINRQYRRENFLFFDLLGDTKLLFSMHKELQVYILKKHHIEVFKLLLNLIGRSQQTNFCYTAENKQYVEVMVNDFLCGLGLQMLQHSQTMADEKALRNELLGMRFMLKGINDCCFDSHLQVAEYFTRVRNDQRAMLLLDDIESRIKGYTDYTCSHAYCKKAITDRHVGKVFDNKISLNEYYKYYRAAPVTYTQDHLPNVPRSLVYEMFRTTVVSPPVSDPEKYQWHNHAVIHCNVYLHYLRFLCFHALERYDHQQLALALISMAWASRNLEKSTGSHIETNHNVLGDCYMTLGHLDAAYIEYRKSLLKQKYHNAAIWHLALLVRRKVLECSSTRRSDIA